MEKDMKTSAEGAVTFRSRLLRWPLILLVIFTLLVFGGWYALWYDWSMGFGAPDHPDFDGYTAAKFQGHDLAASTYTRYKEPGLDIWDFEYKLTYTDNLSVYVRSAAPYPESVASCKSKAPTHGDYTVACDVYPLKNGGRFMIWSTGYKGEKDKHPYIEALIGNSAVTVSLPIDAKAEYTQADWQAYFESLTPVDLRQLQFEQKIRKHQAP